ncbi:hypothetical protein [Croceicoccus naphthovorans]|uniref:hypothetical protein n=1 Tax=Croceicoccus naphthovorans TaxID=1348774 RepID=UPI000AD7C7EF|nr:hypothetical protein [Croceicoccus naphthovorans]MBB3989607.1 hypothetical protein [Croceicoccus naphthovorans]
MKIRFRKSAGAAALLAAGSLALPAHAAPVPASIKAAASGWSVADETANGWGRSDRYWRHRHRGPSGGDVLAGILILGGVVAVAKAAQNSRDRRYRERDDRYRDYRNERYEDRGDYYRDRDYDRSDSYGARRGIDGAIEDCVEEVQRDARVASVDTAERDGSGWQVEGELRGGGRYSCEIDNNGRIRDIDIDGDRHAASDDYNADWDDYESEWRGAQAGVGADAGAEGSERDDRYYAEARARAEEQAPAYEVEREESDGERTWERGAADDRYETASAPATGTRG